MSKLSVAVRKPVIKIVSKPTPVTYIGPGRARETGRLLRTLGVRKALVITDGFLHQSGLLDGLLESIRETDVEYGVFDGVQPDPTFAIVAEAKQACDGCDAVVAVGGGSVLDTAKAVAAAVANHTSAEALAGMLKVRRRPLPLIAVPTTAGTGSETTVAAIISDTATHSKKQLLDPKLVPMFAILDPELTVGLPKHTTAHTALDALTHALEAYVAGYADEETDRQARMAVRLIFKYLPRVQEDPADLEGREGLLTASFFAGMAFTRTYVGYVHAFAHTIGGKFGVPHGLANAVLLPHIMRYYLPVSYHRFAELARMLHLGTPGDSDQTLATRFVKLLYQLNRQLEIPARFEKFPASAIEDVIDMAFRECHGTYPVPRYFTRAHARKLMEAVCAKADD
nr:iron-containing alcohol dehydrogenase [uncultured Flavonifractor sp.]